MAWWIWIVTGVVLLGLELFAGTEFWLFFLGVAAFVLGGLVYGMPDLPLWLQWGGYALLSVTLLIGLRPWIVSQLRKKLPVDAPLLVGDWVVAIEDIGSGEIGRVELRGSAWNARNLGEGALQNGKRARVEAVEGLTLHVREGA